MQIVSIKVRRYRIHRELSVTLDPSLNLIGGPNETGKSTLIEAAHRALFFKASLGGESRNAMVSNFHGHPPEVEVEFRVGGKTYTIAKTFSGPSGSALLREEGGITRRGPEAEAKLAELLGVEEAVGGKKGANISSAQWAHLWVWQGKGGEDPSNDSAPHREALLARLKDQGGGAAMQSELDGRVAGEFQKRYDSLFTKGDKAKAGSGLARAEDDRAAAEEKLREAEDAFGRLESAAREYESAERTIRTCEAEIVRLQEERDRSRESLRRVAELKQREQRELADFDMVAGHYTGLRAAIEEVDELKRKIETLRTEAQPGAETLTRLELSRKEASEKLAAIDLSLEARRDQREKTRRECELMEIAERLRDLRARQTALEKRRAEVAELRTREEKLEAEQARLPGIDSRWFRRLQDAEIELSQGEAVLLALAAGIEVVRAAGEVEVGDRRLKAGESHTIDRETTIRVGDDLELKISPGGGSAIAEKKRAVDDLRERRQLLLDTASVTDIEQAREILTKHEKLTALLRECQARLAGKDSASVESEWSDLRREIEAAEAEQERRQEKAPEVRLGADPERAREALAMLQKKLECLDADEIADLAERKALLQHIEREERELFASQEKARSVDRQLVEWEAQRRMKEEPLGTPDERRDREAHLLQGREEATARLDATREELERLQPEILEADAERLDRAIENEKNRLASASEQRAAARSLLSSNGSLDPAGRLETARAALESAAERHENVRRQAAAIRLLRDRFAEEQQRLSDRFSRPLAEKVGEYLRQVFGPDVSVDVSVEDGAPTGWRMVRDGSGFDFTGLSGGAREQFAAAVRVAVAEILAEEHGGSLPVVFDDAFTNSDPDRIRKLQRMLDLGARHGLQIILLTCDPAAYAGLGAHTVSLR